MKTIKISSAEHRSLVDVILKKMAPKQKIGDKFIDKPKVRSKVKSNKLASKNNTSLTTISKKKFNWVPSFKIEVESQKTGKVLPIAEYLQKPILSKIGTSAFGEFFGIELEVEVADNSLKSRNELIFDSHSLLNSGDSFCIFKKDSSLKNKGAMGFEICTRPASINFHKDKWIKFFNAIPKELEVTDRCGMHVHISKKRYLGVDDLYVPAIGQLQLGKLLAFIHNPDNAEFIKLIAGRGPSEYNQYHDIARSPKASLPKYLAHFKHHSAINVLNPETVEIRIFTSTTNYSVFCKNLEFCHALVRFCFPGSVSIKESANRNTFLKFVNENRKYYPYLASFLADNGFEKYITPLTEHTSTFKVL